MPGTVEKKIADLGITLGTPAAPVAKYVGFVRTGNLLVVSGQLCFDREGKLISMMSLDVAEGQIQGVSAINNPDKLRHLGPLADLGALLRRRS